MDYWCHVRKDFYRKSCLIRYSIFILLIEDMKIRGKGNIRQRWKMVRDYEEEKITDSLGDGNGALLHLLWQGSQGRR